MAVAPRRNSDRRIDMAEHGKSAGAERPASDLLHGVALELGLKSPEPQDFGMSDEGIREQVCEHLSADPQLDLRDVRVTVERGVVQLEGTVSYRAMKHRIEDAAAACPGIKDVDNRIRVLRAES